jgi:hypothetical protein
MMGRKASQFTKWDSRSLSDDPNLSEIGIYRQLTSTTVLQNGKLFSISMLLRILTVNRTGTSGAIDRENIGENHDVPIRLQLCNTVVLGKIWISSIRTWPEVQCQRDSSGLFIQVALGVAAFTIWKHGIVLPQGQFPKPAVVDLTALDRKVLQ